MDKGLLYFFALLAGLLTGLVIWRRWRPLLAERWRALYLLLPAIMVSALPFLIYHYRPEWIWSDDRSLLMSLVLLRALLWILLLLLNLLPSRWFTGKDSQGLTLMQKLCLLPVILGLSGETAVLLLNRGFWPISEIMLTEAANSAFAAGVRNNAYVFLRIIDRATHLPWLGQIWHCPWLTSRQLTTLPAISPAEALTAAGLSLIGISQFFAPDLSPGRSGGQRKKKKRWKPRIRKITLSDK